MYKKNVLHVQYLRLRPHGNGRILDRLKYSCVFKSVALTLNYLRTLNFDAKRCKLKSRVNGTKILSGLVCTKLVCHLQKVSGKTGWEVNGTRLFRSFQQKISPGVTGHLKR